MTGPEPRSGAPVLAPGDQVAVVSPASYPDTATLDALLGRLTSWGLEPKTGPNVVSQHGFLAGDDKARAGDLNNAIRDQGIRAIFTTRGGAGSYRIVDLIDWTALAADPKPLVGFSDITHLHLAWLGRAGVASIHGAAVGLQACSQLWSILFNSGANFLKADPLSPLAALSSSDGQATGPLIGGNLRELAGAVGCGLPSTDGALLVLEDLRHAGLGQVDRNLAQLRRSGLLDSISGLVLGEFSGASRFSGGWG